MGLRVPCTNTNVTEQKAGKPCGILMVKCGLFCVLKSRKPRLRNINSCRYGAKENAQALGSTVAILGTSEPWNVWTEDLAKMVLKNSGFCSETYIVIGHLCCSSLSCYRGWQVFCRLCGVLDSQSWVHFLLSGLFMLVPPVPLCSYTGV